MEEMNLRLVGIQSHMIISHPLLQTPLISSTGEGHMFSTLSANTLLKTSFKQPDMTKIREVEAAKATTMVENLSKDCTTMLTGYVTTHYHAEGGADKPDDYTNFMLRIAQRPYVKYDPDLFSETVQREVSSLEGLQFTNLPEAAALLYKYNDDGTRDTTSAGFVGSVHVYSDVPGAVYTRARMLGSVLSNGNADGIRKVTFWSECGTDGVPLDNDVTFPTPEEEYAVESELTHPGTDSIRDLCSLTIDTAPTVDLKAIVQDIKGDDSRAAVKVYSGSLNPSQEPIWEACGYLKLPEQASLHFKKLHSKDISNQVLMLDF